MNKTKKIIIFLFLIIIVMILFIPVVLANNNSVKYNLSNEAKERTQNLLEQMEKDKENNLINSKESNLYYNTENSNWIITIFIDLIITICFYLVVPLFLVYVLKKEYTQKESKKIAIINSVIVFIIFTLAHILVLREEKLANPAPAFLWGSVAYFILKPKKNNTINTSNAKMSLSKQNEIAPIRHSNLTYSEDVKLQLSESINVIENNYIYCRECGNKLFNTDKFCFKCGSKVILEDIEKEEEKVTIIKEKTTTTESNKLPMVWYKFFTYFRLPLGLFLYTVTLFTHNYSSFTYDKMALGIFFINIALIILLAVSFYMLHNRQKNTLKCIVVLLIAECLSIIGSSITTDFNILYYLIVTAVVFLIWFVPNYIYFNKRKNIFIN